MCNLRKTLDNQQRTNDAVQAIYKYLTEQTTYAEMVELQAKAQVQIMALMRLNTIQVANNGDQLMDDDIATFLWEVGNIYGLIKNFAKLKGQVYGNEE